MRPAPTRCPICQSELSVVRLHCSSCDTANEGHFASGQFSNLTPEQLDFIFTFVRCEGKLTRVEEEMGISYPTIRGRLHEVIRALGYEPGKDEVVSVTEKERRKILEALEVGELSYTEAMRRLEGEA